MYFPQIYISNIMFKDQKENNSSSHIKLYCLCSETLSVWEKVFFNSFSPVIVSHLKWKKKTPLFFLEHTYEKYPNKDLHKKQF